MVNPDPIYGFIGIRYQATIESLVPNSIPKWINISANYDSITGEWGVVKMASGK